MGCEEVKSAKYQTRKSPAFHAGECRGLTKKGKDGSYISKPDSKGVYKWVKATRKVKGAKKAKVVAKKSYLIHDNILKPFKVEVSGSSVAIYKGERRDDDDYDENRDYSTLIKKIDSVQKVYPGKSICDPKILSGSNWDCGYTGGTVLIHVGGNKCIFVGSTIYEFTIDDEIEDFFSNSTGGTDVQLPVLLGSTYVYLLGNGLEFYIPREMFKGPMTPVEWSDAESYVYGYKNFKTGEKVDNKRQSLPGKLRMKLKGYKLIHKRHQ
jgi:hypothetical protein